MAETTLERPTLVVVGSALLVGSALALLATWALGIDAVESNGARVFFVMLWGYFGWAAYRGGGWVRVAIVAVFGVSIWGAINGPSLAGMLTPMPPGELLAKGFALIALVLLCLPAAHAFFAAVAKQERAER